MKGRKERCKEGREGGRTDTSTVDYRITITITHVWFDTLRSSIPSFLPLVCIVHFTNLPRHNHTYLSGATEGVQ